MRLRRRSYTTYTIGCAIVWAVLLGIAGAAASTSRLHNILLVFAGWVLGWVSATIARYVYPPPKNPPRWGRGPASDVPPVRS